MQEFIFHILEDTVIKILQKWYLYTFQNGINYINFNILKHVNISFDVL